EFALGYRDCGRAISKERTFSGRKPGDTAVSRAKLFESRPAPTSRMKVIASSEITRNRDADTRRLRLPRRLPVRRRSTGARPKSKPVAVEIARVNARIRQSIDASCRRGISAGLAARRIRIPH